MTFRPLGCCIYMLGLLACAPEDSHPCAALGSCQTPYAFVEPPAFEFQASADASTVTLSNVGTGVLRVREMRLEADPSDAVIFEVLGALPDRSEWLRQPEVPFAMAPGEALTLRLTRRSDRPLTGHVRVRTNSPDQREIMIPIDDPATMPP